MKMPLKGQFLSLALACMVGCAGGGGGGASMTSNPYPPINSVTQSTALSVVSSNVTFNNPTTTLASTGGTVDISASGSGATITTVNLTVGGASGVSFQQTFNSFTPQIAQGATVLYVASVTASDGSVRQMLFANPNFPPFSLTYTTFGLWEYDVSAIATSGVGGAFATGVATRTKDLPTTGSANYSGGMVGRYADGTTSWAVTANAFSMADFGAGTLSLTTSQSFKAPVAGGNPISDQSLNLSGALLFPPGTNQLSGTLTSTSGMTGPASAKFFGPGAQEVGGTFFVTNGGSLQMNGAFGLHR